MPCDGVFSRGPGNGDRGSENLRASIQKIIISSAVIALAVMGCTLGATTSAQTAGPSSLSHSRLASYNWSVKASPNLAQKPPPLSEIESFLNALQVSLGGPAAYGKNGNGEAVICSFRFADLRGNGYLSLVVGSGASDRSMCREVDIIDRVGPGFELYFWEGDPDSGRDVAGKLKDLNHDSKDEFLLTNSFGKIEHQCIARWTAIFAWTGSNYTNVSDNDFNEFYREQLNSLHKQISALHPIRVYGGGFIERRDKQCLLAEAAKLQRHLGISPEAGLDQAVHLASSEDATRRRFAAQVFGDIGSPQARKYLETLSKDPDPVVRKTARSYLSALSRGPTSVAPESFYHPQGPESLTRY